PAPAPIWTLAFSPDGKVLAAGSYRQVQLWDASARTHLRTLSGPVGPVRCLAWSADGKHLAGGGGRPGELGEVRVWNVTADAATEIASLSEHKDVVEGVAFPPSGEALLSAGDDEKVLATELASRKELRAMTDHTNRV